MCLLIGPTGAGKTLLLKRLSEQNEELHAAEKLFNGEANMRLQGAINKKDFSDATISQASTGKSGFGNISQIPPTVATVGSNLVSVNIQKKQDITIRELGGCMGPIWQNYFNDCKAIIYMVDVSNRFQISASCIQLLMILSHELLVKTPVLIMFNKIDMPSRLSQSEIESIFRLQDILKNAVQKISVEETSVHTGQGIQEVIKWIQKCHK